MMCRFSRATHLLLVLTVFVTHHHEVDASPLYPSNSFGPSMRASATASTIVAVTAPVSDCDDTETSGGECCVILTKSHVPSGGKNGDADNRDADDDDDGDGGVTVASVLARDKARAEAEATDEIIAMMSREREGLSPGTFDTWLAAEQPDLQPIVRPGRHTPTISVLSTGSNNAGTPPLIAAFTGFTPDVHHLSLRLAKTYSNHLHLFGGIPMRTDKAAQNLADVVRSAASDEGRPYGVQALVVGDRPRSQKLQIYTIDPAGGCTHWSGGGTAIGKDAELVRKCLLTSLRPNDELKRLSAGVIADLRADLRDIVDVDDEDIVNPGASRGPPKSWQDALDRAMMATLEATLSGDMDEAAIEDWVQGEEFNTDAFRATVAFTGRCSAMVSANTKIFGISSEVLRDSYDKCMRTLANEQVKRILR